MEIRFNKVVLRPPEPRDAPAAHQLWNDPVIASLVQPGRPVPMPEAVFRRRIENGESGFFCGGFDDIEWVITRKDDPTGAALGVGGLYEPSHHHGVVEIGVMLLPGVRGAGQGTGLDSMLGLAEAAFKDYGMHKVVAHIKGSNTAALGTCARIGLREHGVLPEHRFRRNGRESLHLFGLLASDWDPALADWRDNDGPSRNAA